ncbi:uncharacterized protein KZ484_001664 isoform 2-T2 [Pholidichthys leucotaenia]
MDNLETVYEEELPILDCKVCNKILKGESLYKIHLTTAGHLKKEDALVNSGVLVRQKVIPEFTDILQYLDFLELDEPIIGLRYMEEEPFDPNKGLMYTCMLCKQTLILTEAVSHLIGRKHRQKYVEAERRDLMTWDSHTASNFGGKYMRAKAEIIERQDGRGHPLVRPKKKVIPRAAPRQREDGDQRRSEQPEFMDYQRRASDYPDMFRQDDANRYGFGRSDEALSRRGDFRERESSFPADDRQRGILPDPVDVANYGYRREMPPGRAEREYYPGDGAPPYRRAYAESASSEGIRGGQHEGDNQWPSRDSDRRYNVNRFGDAEARGSSFSTPVDPSFTRFDVVRDYHHEMRDGSQEEPFGLQRGGASATAKISDLPEPFRQFLKGEDKDERLDKRKRKSRFSDATAEDLSMMKPMVGAERSGPPNPKYSSDPRSVSVPLRPDIGGDQYSDPYRASQSSRSTDRGDSGFSDIFDVVKNIEIESTEEANFLKEKLLDLMQEFRRKKMEKQSSQDVSRSYSDYSLDHQQSIRQQYERTLGSSSDPRQHDEVQGDAGRGGWRQHERLSQERHQAYDDPPHMEPRHAGRGSYAGAVGEGPSAWKTPTESSPGKLFTRAATRTDRSVFPPNNNPP